MKTISFVNMKGGVAKTTLAFNVSMFLSQREQKRVLMIDMDPQFNLTQCALSTPEYLQLINAGGDTVAKIFDTKHILVSSVKGAKQSEPKELDEIKPTRVNTNLDILPGTLDLYRLPDGNGIENKLRRFVEYQKDNYDYIIIDTPPTPSMWMTSALIASDGYIIPVKADPLSRIGIELLRSVVKEKTDTYGLKIDCFGLVFTIVERHTRVYLDAVEKYKTDPIWKDLLYKGALIKRADVARYQIKDQDGHKTILEMDDTDLKSEMNSIVKELLTK